MPHAKSAGPSTASVRTTADSDLKSRTALITFWGTWTAACAVGWIVAGPFSGSMAPALFGWALYGLVQWCALRTVLRVSLMWVVVCAVAGSLSIGAFAGAEMLLNRYDPTMVWDSGRLSPPIAVAGDENGDEVGENQSMFTRDAVLWTWALAGAILGGFFGAAQWTILRKKLSRAVCWIPAQAAAWSAGAALVGLLANPLFTASDGTGIDWWRLAYCVLVGGACTGGISGAALVWLIRHPIAIDSQVESSASQ